MNLFRSVRLVVAALAIGTLVLTTACEDKTKKQIEDLTLEINQLDSARTATEAELDKSLQEKESILAQAESDKKAISDLTERLRAANAGVTAAQAKTNQLLAQLNEWKGKAEKLAEENTALKAQIEGLTARVAQAEQRAAAAEERAAAVEAKYAQLLATVNKTYYVSAFDVKGIRGTETDSKNRILPSADKLVFSVTIGKPEGSTAGAGVQLTVSVFGPDGKPFAQSGMTLTETGGTAEVDVKGQKLDLKKGRYTVALTEGGTKKYEGFFLVER